MTTAGVIGAVVLLVAGALVPVLMHGRGATRGAAARARSAHARLGHALATVKDVDPDVRRTAAERWTAAGAVLAQARSVPDFELAERTADEGLALVTGRG